MAIILEDIRKKLPAGFAELRTDSLGDGYQFLQKLEAKRDDGANRFDRPGERLLAAWLDSALAGIGGVNIEPYLNDVTWNKNQALSIRRQRL